MKYKKGDEVIITGLNDPRNPELVGVIGQVREDVGEGIILIRYTTPHLTDRYEYWNCVRIVSKLYKAMK